MLNWDDLRFFLALADAGTIRGASDRLAVTHATVTRRVHALEEQMGAALFQRTPNGHRLTQAGQSILPLAREAQVGMLNVERRIAAFDTRLTGTVTLALPEAIATCLIAPLLARLRGHYPGVNLKLLLDDRLVNLSENEADVALRLTASPPVSAHGRRVANSPLCVYAAPGYLAVRPETDVWIGLEYRPAQDMAGGAEPTIQANGLLAMGELLASGLGIGVLPCFLGDTHPGLVRVPGTVPKPDLDLWLLIHPDLRKVARVRAVADFLSAEMKKLRPVIEGRAVSPPSKKI